jgi:outer membrane protein insertion porin family
MANTTGPAGSRQSLFEQLNSADPKQQQEQAAAAAAREQRQYQQAQARLAEIVDENSTLPTTIGAIRVIGAPNTRKGFLEKILNPLLSANNDRPYTFGEALRNVNYAADKLHRLDIFHEPITMFVDRSDKSNPNSAPTDIDIYLNCKEKSKWFVQTGTEVGNVEGAAYARVAARNIFGGAESLNLYGSMGTRTRNEYQGTFDTPIASNPDYTLQVGGLTSSTIKSWASHEEALKEGWGKFKWLTKSGDKHELTYTGAWRQVTGLSQDASQTVRADAGDSVKSSISHTWITDSRDYPLLPTKGYYMKTLSEIAGWGPLQGDVAFWKSEVVTQTAIPIPIPGVENSGISFTTGLRAGLLYPLTLSSQSSPQPSRINDRFTLGGPGDVRGFRMCGLGPRDGSDSVGGDVYAAGGASLLFPLPKVGPNKPFRLQAFINGGRLLALQQPEKEGRTDGNQVQKNVYSTVAKLGDGLPSMAVGLGLVYAHPVARFELNFSLPLVLRKGEEGRKGLQFGVGINLL